jgi:hypothetical protein
MLLFQITMNAAVKCLALLTPHGEECLALLAAHVEEWLALSLRAQVGYLYLLLPTCNKRLLVSSFLSWASSWLATVLR